jgi:hypothetical protein
MTYLHAADERIGFYDLAISFASDANEYASVISQFANYYDIKCYFYIERIFEQYGLNIYETMEIIYRKTPNIAIINSNLYYKSSATIFEYDIIRSRNGNLSTYIFQNGGGILPKIRKDTIFSDFSEEGVIKMLLRIRASKLGES